MIHLYWKRIILPETEQKSYWATIDETQLNMDDFTEQFARQIISKQSKTANKPAKKPKFIKVLDNKRFQSVGIFAQSLHRARIDSKSIEHAIYNWDTTSIGLDLMQQMLEHKATNKELQLIKEALAAQPDLPLDGPEEFLLQLSEISCAAERISCLIFCTEFDECSQQIEQKIGTIQTLCEFLMGSESLKVLFSIILTLGNFMNGGNSLRGQADGFGLDVLNKLNDVKSKDKKITLLHYIVKAYMSKRLQNGQKLKELVFPIPETNAVKSACTIDFIALNEQITQLQKKLCGMCATYSTYVLKYANHLTFLMSFRLVFDFIAHNRLSNEDAHGDRCINCIESRTIPSEIDRIRSHRCGPSRCAHQQFDGV